MVNVGLRVVAFLGLVWWLLPAVLLPTLLLTLVLFVTATIYDRLREPTVDPGSRSLSDLLVETRGVARAIHILVGFGYGVRIVFGYLLAVTVLGLPVEPDIVGYVAVFGYLFGVLFVALSWAVDAIAYCEEVVARSTADTVRIGLRFQVGVVAKPHLANHLDYVDWETVTVQEQLSNRRLGGYSKPYRDVDSKNSLRLVPTVAAFVAALVWIPLMVPCVAAICGSSPSSSVSGSATSDPVTGRGSGSSADR